MRLMDYFAELEALLQDKGIERPDKELAQMAVLYRDAGYTPQEAAQLEAEEEE